MSSYSRQLAGPRKPGEDSRAGASIGDGSASRFYTNEVDYFLYHKVAVS